MAEPPQTIDARTAQLLLFLSIIWGGSFFFTGAAIRELPPLTVALARVTLGAAFLLPQERPDDARWWMPWRYGRWRGTNSPAQETGGTLLPAGHKET